MRTSPPPCAALPHLTHALPGRIRIHLPASFGEDDRRLEAWMRAWHGVRHARVNALTRNALILFDPSLTSAREILAHVRTPAGDAVDRPHGAGAPAPPQEPHGRAGRVPHGTGKTTAPSRRGAVATVDGPGRDERAAGAALPAVSSSAPVRARRPAPSIRLAAALPRLVWARVGRLADGFAAGVTGGARARRDTAGRPAAGGRAAPDGSPRWTISAGGCLTCAPAEEGLLSRQPTDGAVAHLWSS